MTAGGGWGTFDALLALPIRRGVDIVIELERCTGACCREFMIMPHAFDGGLTPDELRAAAAAAARVLDEGPDGYATLASWPDRNGVRQFRLFEGVVDVAAMAVYLGFGPTSLGWMGHLYTCKHHCTATGNCTAYATRPKMCSSHGVQDVCDFPDCEQRVQVNPLVLRDPSTPPQVLPAGWTPTADWPWPTKKLTP